jgi:hypothetical protein
MAPPRSGLRAIASAPTRDRPESLMSRKHANLIHSIFHDPPSGNIHWRDVESLLKHVGASLEPISGARVRVKLNRMEDVLHRPHHSNVLDTTSLAHLREFLARAGVTPSLYDAKRAE